MRQRDKIKWLAYPGFALCMTACTFTPEIPDSGLTGSADGGWPQLLPMRDLAALSDGAEKRPAAVDAELEELNARVAALRARAARMNSPVLSPKERQTLAEAAATP